MDPFRRPQRRRCFALLAVLFAWLWPRHAQALTDEEIFRSLRFEFGTKGARAVALGGAFVGVADDVSAADANPAGLCNLQASQLLVEYRSIQADDASTAVSGVGSLAVNPVSGERSLPYLSLSSTAAYGSSGAFDFVGYVWPVALASGRRVALAGSRQVVLSSERTLSSPTEAQFAFDSFPNTVVGGTVQAYSVTTPVTGTADADIVYWNASAAATLGADFTVGATLTYATFDLDASTSTDVIDPLELFVDPEHPRLPSQPGADLYQTTAHGSDSAFTYAFGIQWQPNSTFPTGESPWRFGVVYRKGVKFEAPEAVLLNGVADRAFQNAFVLPDRYAVGGSYAWGPRWLFAAQLERVEYSDELEGFESGVNFFTSGRVTDGAFATNPNTPVTFSVDDGTFVRAGAEYRVPLASGHQLALRGGYYRSPDHQIRMTQFNSTDPAVNAMYLQAFPAGEAANHLTAGVGYTFGSSSFHLALDASSEEDRIVGSYALLLGGKNKK